MEEQDKSTQPGFHIQKVYTKDLSFEAPNAPEIFRDAWKPAVHIDLDTLSAHIEGDLHEVVLKVSISAKLEDKTAFAVEVHQAGIFALSNLSDDQRAHCLGAVCPNILYPFLRETVSDLVMRGGFPQLLLAPINFEVLYAQKRAKELETVQ